MVSFRYVTDAAKAAPALDLSVLLILALILIVLILGLIVILVLVLILVLILFLLHTVFSCVFKFSLLGTQTVCTALVRFIQRALPEGVPVSK